MLLGLLYQIPEWMQRIYSGVIWKKEDGRKCIYLTFDDGPTAEYTGRILEILREKEVRATFFVVGGNVSRNPELLDAVLADGHRVGNHTFHHIKGLRTACDAYLEDVEKCEKLIEAAQRNGGEERLFRPPYGRMSFAQKRALAEKGYTTVLWDVLTHDYNKSYSPQKMLEIIRRFSRPGSVVVFHDSVKSGDRMLEALPLAIDFWKREGYELRTL